MSKHRLLVIDLIQAAVPADLLGDLETSHWALTRAQNLDNAHQLFISTPKTAQVVLVLLPALQAEILASLETLMRANPGQTHPEWVILHPPVRATDVDDNTLKCFEHIEDLAYLSLDLPLPAKRLSRILHRATKAALISARVHNITVQQLKRYQIASFYGSSKAAGKVREFIRRLADVPLSTLFIFGETGTGKGLVARLIHHTGRRHDGPLIELNCAALPQELLESELFGHEAGAFTGAKNRHRGLIEQADGGTLFLDEIGDMAVGLQAKLLKAIEDQCVRPLGSEQAIEVDVQIIAATSADLSAAMAAGDFREDLYHRLSVFSLTLPPLRERLHDLTDLVPPMIVEFNHKARKRVTHVPDDAWQALMQHSWPGNVRELRNVIERCVLFAESDTLPTQWLQLTIPGATAHIAPAPADHSAQRHDSAQDALQSAHESAQESVQASTAHTAETQPSDATRPHITIPLDGSLSLDAINKEIITQALLLEHNNISRAAKRLGITRQTLRYRITKYDIDTSAHGSFENSSENM